ncbi:hypothetical protein EG329_006572 [Mollisiaceae sp. DMI_Dod_QoI]|nr:hypothetical protein EG329_006572 [Helotiales sp. DMI_Dod_QoI]
MSNPTSSELSSALTTITKHNHKPLSELTLSSPSPLSFKALTSHARDITFREYANEPVLFTVSVPDSNPSPITLLLKSNPSSQAKSPTAKTTVIAQCVPHGLSAKPKKWDVIVPITEREEVDDSGRKGSMDETREVKSALEKVGKDTYELSVPWLRLPPPDIPGSKLAPRFQWLRTTRETHSKRPPTTFSSPDWKLVNPLTSEVHAVFVERWGATERGSLQFRRSFWKEGQGREWEVSVVISVGLLVEEERRRKIRRGNFAMGFARSGGGGVV